MMPRGAGSLLIFGGIPHCLQSLDPETKLILKRNYRTGKRYLIGGSLVGYASYDGVGLVYDIVRAEIKAQGYKVFGALILGPVLQAISLPFYVVTGTLKIQRYAVLLAQLGALVTRAQVSISDWGFFAIDMLLFGEIVPILDESNPLMIYHNNTRNVMMAIAEEEYGIMRELSDVVSGGNVTEVLSATPYILNRSQEMISAMNSLTPNITGEGSN